MQLHHSEQLSNPNLCRQSWFHAVVWLTQLVAFYKNNMRNLVMERKPRLFFWHQIILNCQATCSPCANTSHQLCKRCASTCSATIPPSRLQKFLHICHWNRTTCCPSRPTCRLSIYIPIKRAAASSASNLSRFIKHLRGVQPPWSYTSFSPSVALENLAPLWQQLLRHNYSFLCGSWYHQAKAQFFVLFWLLPHQPCHTLFV